MFLDKNKTYLSGSILISCGIFLPLSTCRGISFGCILGMLPLIYPEAQNLEKVGMFVYFVSGTI